MAGDVFVKVLLAVALGGLLGMEREFRDKAAGFRTIILITVGATMFTHFSLDLGQPSDDPVRIAAGIVSGVGFLGAGVILRHRGEIVGITTAATIWLAAALGMGVGSGRFLVTTIAAAVVLTVLWVFPYLEFWIDLRVETHTYEIAAHPDSRASLTAAASHHKLRILEERFAKNDDQIVLRWRLSGSHAGHERFSMGLLDDPTVASFDY